MAQLIKQVPAIIHIETAVDDGFRLSLDFDIDLTGYTIAAEVKPKGGGTPIAFTVDRTSDSLGQFDLVLDALAITTLGVKYHGYRLWLIPPGGQRRTYIAGRFIISEV